MLLEMKWGDAGEVKLPLDAVYVKRGATGRTDLFPATNSVT
jgi:hypothetical protein